MSAVTIAELEAYLEVLKSDGSRSGMIRTESLEAVLAEVARLRALEARVVLVTASYSVSAVEADLFRGEDLRDRIMRGLVDGAMLEVLKHARFKSDDGPRASVLHRAEITVISNPSGAPELIA